MKQIAGLVIFIVLVGAMLCVYAEEAETFTSGDYKYTLNEDGSAVITRYKGKAKNLTIPSELEGHTVKCIGDSAFRRCDSLTSITLPDSVTSIGDSAFSGCSRLTSITLPDSVADLGANPWMYCTRLTTINVSPRHPSLAVIDGVLYSKADQRLVWYPMTSKVSALEVPNGIRIIGDYAFYYCYGLTSITLPDSVTSISDYAFQGCYSLTSITLPDSITDLGSNPWLDCERLSTINVSPKHPSLAVIDGALYSKADKRLIWYPMTSKADTFEVPDGILSIDSGAFAGCSSLTTITLPDSVTNIGKGAFLECGSLISITLPDSVTNIGKGAFLDCPDLTLTVTINSYAEQYCIDNNLRYQFPDSLDRLNN